MLPAAVHCRVMSLEGRRMKDSFPMAASHTLPHSFAIRAKLQVQTHDVMLRCPETHVFEQSRHHESFTLLFSESWVNRFAFKCQHAKDALMYSTERFALNESAQ